MKKIFLDQREIKKILPHREPLLFLDQITKLDDNSITAEKEITEKDCWGHFSPPKYVFPGHLALEALSQAAACLVLSRYPELKNKKVALAKTKGKFRSPIFPGDRVKIQVHLEKVLNRKKDGRFFSFSGQIQKEGFIVVEWSGIGKYF